jgi:hypothetical protein
MLWADIGWPDRFVGFISPAVGDTGVVGPVRCVLMGFCGRGGGTRGSWISFLDPELKWPWAAPIRFLVFKSKTSFLRARSSSSVPSPRFGAYMLRLREKVADRIFACRANLIFVPPLVSTSWRHRF